MKQTILCNREDIRKVEAEEQLHFLRSILEEIGLTDLDEYFPENNDPELYTVEQKIKLRQLLEKFQISVIDDRDGGLKIYVEKELIADWKKCRFAFREDLAELDRSKRIYAEIYIEYWSQFEK